VRIADDPDALETYRDLFLEQSIERSFVVDMIPGCRVLARDFSFFVL